MSGWIIPKDVPLAITVIVGDATPIIIRGQMTNSTARCPQCGTASGRIHRAYWRTVQDLPWRTVPVSWLLRCRRFWCPNPACARTLFCERLPAAWVAARQRRTTAVWTHLTTWGWTASAADVARVATGQGLSVSPDTIIRALRRAPDPPVGDLRVVGVDEWALRATILVDQEEHRMVDVLPDDRPATVATWLAAHPTIRVVTRDRDAAFAKAIAVGAPDATQVADRFHLLQNLRQVLERVFHQHGVGPSPGDPTPTAVAADPGGHRAPAPTLGAQHRQDRWTQVRALSAAGHSISAIARQLNLDRSTVRQYATAATCPAPPARAERPRALAGWTGRLEALWQAGEHRGLRLFKKLQSDGYTGSLSAVHRWRARHHHAPAPPPETPAPPRSSPATRAWPCRQRPPDWSRTTARALTRALQDPTVRTAYTLAHLFRTLMKYRRPQALEPWLRRADASGLPAFQHFATSLRRDLAAVTAAVAGPWSQGLTEGFNHKIKRTKRLMYRRAKFDLLRIRILHAPA